MTVTLPTIIVVVEIVAGLLLALSIAWLSLTGNACCANSVIEGAVEPGHATLPPNKYHPVHVAIHWSVVFAMAQLLTRGALIMVNIPNSSPEKVDAVRAHALAGTAVLVLMLFRLVLLKTTRLPRPANGPIPSLDLVKRIVHPALYVSIIVQAIAGLGMAVQADLPRLFFLHEGALPQTFWIYPMRTVHYVNSRLLIVLIGLHIVGALYHTFVSRDGLLRRMSFGGRLRGPGRVAEPVRGVSPTHAGDNSGAI